WYDENGNVLEQKTFSYQYPAGDPTPSHRLLRKTVYFKTVTDPENRRLRLVRTYNPDTGKVIKVQEYDTYRGADPLRTREFGYNDFGQKTSEKLASGSSEIVFTWTYSSWGDLEEEVIPGSPIQKRRYIQTSLSRDSNAGKPARFVTLSYDHFDENAQGDDPHREGTVTITVSDLDGRLVERAEGYIPATDTTIEDDFDYTKSDLADAFLGAGTGRKLFKRFTFEYDGDLLSRRIEWSNASDPSAAKYVTTYEEKYGVGRRVRTESLPGGTIRRSVFDSFDRIVEYSEGTSADNLTVLREYFYDYEGEPVAGENQGDGALTRLREFVGKNEGENPLYRITRYYYDFRGRLLWQATWEGVSGDSDIESEADVVEKVYDNQGRIKTIERFRGAWNGAAWTATATQGGVKLWKLVQSFKYDEMGLRYQTAMHLEREENGNQVIGPTYYTTTWYDVLGNVLKVQEASVEGGKLPSSLFVKYGYDGFGRQISVYYGYDPQEGASSDPSLNGDVILYEEHYTLDDAGKVLGVTTFERKSGEDSSWTEHYGSLASGDFPSQYVRMTVRYFWYDHAGRLTHKADYGTNFTLRPSQPPSQSSQSCMVTSYEYGFTQSAYSEQDSSWYWVKVKEPTGKETFTFYDNLGRRVRLVRNFQGTGQAGASENVTTKFSYDSEGKLINVTAVEVEEGQTTEQVTQYVYGVTQQDNPGPSAYTTGQLLRKVIFADGASLTFGYDGLGRIVYRKDRNGTVRLLSYNGAGYLASDEVDAQSLPDFVDSTVLKHRFTYDNLGRLCVAVAAGANGEVNRIERTYGSNGFLSESKQTHTARNVQALTVAYNWTQPDEEIQQPRLSRLGYPSGRSVFYNYRKGSEVWDRKDYAAGRVSSLSAFLGGSSPYASMTYEGLGRAVRVENQVVSPSVVTEFLDSGGDPGFDEFGRVKRIRTQRDGQTIMDYTYAYDWQKSPLAPVSRTDAGPLGSEQNQYYDYDGLERLVSFKRGQEEQNPQYTKDWTLTALGNWDVVSDSQLTDQRDHNSVNEISSRKLNGTTVLPKDDPNDPSYDPEGNLRKIPSDNAGGTSDYFEAIYDPWNKLVRIQAGSQVKAKYVRDALGRIAWDETSGEHYYWSASWQRLAVYEEQEDSLALKKEEVWGVRYIDEILCAFDTEDSGTKARVYVQDANWNVAAVYDSSDNTDSLELITYTPYGKPTFWKKVSGAWEEQSQLSSRKGADHLFQGRWLCAYESSGLQLQLYHFRHRAYSPTLGRFLQRDRAATYNAYNFAGSRPTYLGDPFGLYPLPPIYFSWKEYTTVPDPELEWEEIEEGQPGEEEARDFLAKWGDKHRVTETNEFRWFSGHLFLNKTVDCSVSYTLWLGANEDPPGCCSLYLVLAKGSRHFKGQMGWLYLCRKVVEEWYEKEEWEQLDIVTISLDPKEGKTVNIEHWYPFNVYVHY
ncbi:MAG: hypothetical protein DRN21_02210, partial [Thermoplasmata archaeon]